MRVTVLEFIEDANEFTDAAEIKQVEAGAKAGTHAILRVKRDKEGKVVSVFAVSRLAPGSADLPASQARNLIAIRKAKKA